MRFLKIAYIIVGFAVCIYSYFYLYCICQIIKYHSLGLISDEIKDELLDDSKLNNVKNLINWHKRTHKIIADAKKNTQA